MPFSNASDTFDPPTLAILSKAFEDAWAQVVASHRVVRDAAEIRTSIAERIMNAARNGVRDPAALVAAGVDFEEFH